MDKQQIDQYLNHLMSDVRVMFIASICAPVEQIEPDMTQWVETLTKNLGEAFDNALGVLLNNTVASDNINLRQELSSTTLSLPEEEKLDAIFGINEKMERLQEDCQIQIAAATERYNHIIEKLRGTNAASIPFSVQIVMRALVEMLRKEGVDQADAAIFLHRVIRRLTTKLANFYVDVYELLSNKIEQIDGELNDTKWAPPAMNRKVVNDFQETVTGSQPASKASSAIDTLALLLDSYRREHNRQTIPDTGLARARQGLIGQLSDAIADNRINGDLLTDISQGKQLLGWPVALRRSMMALSQVMENLANDSQRSVSLRPALRELHIPVLKAALLDESLISNKLHPVRVFLNKLDSMIAAVPASAGATHPACSMLLDIVGLIKRGFVDNFVVFEQASELLKEFEADRRRNIISTLQRLELRVASEEIRERNLIEVHRMIHALLTEKLPSVVYEFLVNHWLMVVAAVRMKSGGSGADWQQYLETANQLIELARLVETKAQTPSSYQLTEIRGRLEAGLLFLESNPAMLEQMVMPIIGFLDGSLPGSQRYLDAGMPPHFITSETTIGLQYLRGGEYINPGELALAKLPSLLPGDVIQGTIPGNLKGLMRIEWIGRTRKTVVFSNETDTVLRQTPLRLIAEHFEKGWLSKVSGEDVVEVEARNLIRDLQRNKSPEQRESYPH